MCFIPGFPHSRAFTVLHNILSSVPTSQLDNYRWLYDLNEGDPTIAVATQDNLYWVIVHAKGSPHVFASDSGHQSEADALQDTAQDLSNRVWQMAKDNHITLPK